MILPLWQRRRQREPTETLRVTGSTFEGSGLVRGVWFDLDVRDTEVSNNTFNNSRTFGVFYEGSNNGWVHHNTFNDSGAWWVAPTSSAYVSHPRLFPQALPTTSWWRRTSLTTAPAV
jgi:parallel beta-helix repeat protein